MDTVTNNDDAMQWFLSHSGGEVICKQGEFEEIVDNYPDAVAFFNERRESR